MAERKRIQCLDRTLDIMEALAAHGEMGVSELARKLGLHVATIHNILVTLASRNYLLRNSGRYRLGPALAVLASGADPLPRLPDLAQPLLDEVTRETGESAVAAVLVGARGAMVATTPGTDEIAVQFPKEGFPDPLALCTGRVVVAQGAEEGWDGFIERHLARDKPATGEQDWGADEWRAHLRRLRSDGYGVLSRPRGTSSVAVPVRGPGGGVVAALGASCPFFRATEEHLENMLTAVRGAAERLARELGYVPPATGR